MSVLIAKWNELISASSALLIVAVTGASGTLFGGRGYQYSTKLTSVYHCRAFPVFPQSYINRPFEFKLLSLFFLLILQFQGIDIV